MSHANSKLSQAKIALRLILAAGLLFAGLSGAVQPASAATNVPYIDASGNPQVAPTATDLTSSSTTWTTGWYVLSSSVTISSRIVVSGDVDLILEDGYTLGASSGITVAQGNSLTIYGQTAGSGTLTAGPAPGPMAGIGGDAGSATTATAGTITVNGGTIQATGGDLGAGIGGASSTDGTIIGSGGNITINAGTVTTQGGSNHGPGIGGGGCGDGGNITITGGTVSATGGPYGGAGIGGGAPWNCPAGDGGNIVISGGTVTATGNSSAYGGGAGIGGSGGDNSSGSYPGGDSGTITITGTAHVTATGGSGVSAIWPVPSGGGGAAAIGGGGTNGDPGGSVTGDIYIASTVTLNLTAGTGVSAQNGVQVGSGGSNTYAGTALLPTAPQNLTAAPANTQVTLNWQPPSTTGLPITSAGYTVRISSDAGATWTSLGSVGNVLSYTVTGLTDGTTYSFAVCATNATGTGPWSAAVTATPEPSPPSAPQNVAVTPGNAQATVTFSPPADNGGDSNLTYTVTATPTGGGTTVTQSGSGSPIIVAGLTNGVQYSFVVTASNVSGAGSPSTAVDATPLTTPGAPQNLAATPGDGQVALSWDAPALDGGSVITSYQVSSDGGNTWTNVGDQLQYTVTGLTDGTGYTFAVQAINAAGAGAGATVASTPLTVPGAPTIVAASPGNAQVVVTFSAPANDGGDTITSYAVTATPTGGGTTVTATGTTSPITVTGLVNGQEYSITVAATNGAGTGPASTAVTTTPFTTPGPVQNVIGTPAHNEVTLTWAAPAANGGSAITNYQVTSDGGTTWTPLTPSDPSATTYTFTGLTDGVTYTLGVQAVNAAGSGPAVTVTATPVGAPSSPQNLTVTAVGNGTATLGWQTPSSDGGSAITNYEVSADGGNTWTPLAPPDPAATSYTYSGLTNGIIYQLCVRAVNAVGEGASSETVTATPFTTPGAPQAVTVTPGDAEAIVSFSPPPSDGGSPITSYTVTATPTGGGTAITATGTASPITVTGLANGVEYSFTVAATNSGGTGPASAAVLAIPRTVPGAPQNLAATAGDGQITLTWVAPAFDGGSPLTNYEVSSDGGSTWTPLTPANPTATSQTITGLTNGTTYAVAVRADNVAGSGPVASTTATPLTTPDAPTGLTTTSGNAQVTVAFIPPASTGGSPITSYTATATPTGGGSAISSTGTASPITVTGLTNGVQYSFTVAAANAAGTGPESAAVTATPMTVPSAPQNLTADASGAQQVTLTWTTPADNGGSPITDYQVSDDGGSTWISLGSATATTYTFTNQTSPGLVYYCVRAVNQVGPGAVASSPVLPTDVPGAPLNVTVTPANGQATVAFDPPTSDGNTPITSYTVTATPAGGGAVVTATSAASPITVTGLTNGVEYSFTVAATNADGTGADSTAVTATPFTTAGAPQNLAATPGDHQVTLNWQVPLSNGGSAITSYQVSSDGGSTWTNIGNVLAYTVSGLTNGLNYVFAVQAINAAGPGPSATTFATPLTVPDAPQNVAVTPGDRQATVTYLPPGSDGGSAITSYTVTATPTGGGTAVTATGSSSPITVTGLTNGVSYSFTVAATNAAGTGPPSSPQNATPLTTPGVPQNFSGAPSDGQVVLTWAAPASDGGSPISGYQVSTDNGVTWVNVTGTTYTATGLTNSVAYTFAVRAQNAAGVGPTTTLTATPTAAPGSPQNVAAAPGNGQLTVTFSPPATSDPISYYTVTISPANSGGTTTFTGGSSPITVTGLANGTTYSVVVTATNTNGQTGAGSAVIHATPASVPSAPQSISATGGDRQATVMFTAPASDGGSPVTSYTVTATDGTNTFTATGSSSPITVPGLTNGTAYSFTVSATNSAGTGPASAIATATPFTVPSPPLNLIATPGPAQVALTWQAPASDGGSAITGYEVSTDGGTNWTPVPGGATALSYTATGLTNGTTYTLVVSAINAGGAGSGASVVSTPLTTPGAPQNPVIKVGNARATVTFTPPTSNGGSPITGYTVTATPVPSGTPITTNGTASPITVTGLTNGVSYSFTVAATNAAGTGPNSAAATATPITTPGAPTGLAATPGAGQASLSWTAPIDDGGSPVTSYVITINPALPGGSTSLTVTGTSTTVTGLTNGVTYTFTVAAENASGTGPASAPATAVASTTPDAPTGLQVVPGDGTITLSWGAPSYDGGSAITSYEVSTDSGGTWQPVPGGASTLTYTAGSLTNGSTYNVSVRALNVNGAGAQMAFVAATPAAVPGPPAIISATPGNSQVQVVFTTPASDGGSTITGYTVTATPVSSGTPITMSGTASPITVTGLTNGVSYNFTVAATNDTGTGPASTALSATPFTTSDSPRSVKATPGNGQVVLSWTTPAFNGGSPITNYEVSSDNGATWTPLSPANPAATSYTFTGLTNGTSSVFAVRAVNAGGNSPAAKASATPRTVPAAPTGVTLTPGNGQLTVKFTPPADNGGSPILHYLVTVTPVGGGSPITVTGTASPITVPGLAGGASYTVTVAAVNAAGQSVASQLVTGRVPLAPTPSPTPSPTPTLSPTSPPPTPSQSPGGSGDSGGSGNSGGKLAGSGQDTGTHLVISFGLLAAASLCLLGRRYYLHMPRNPRGYQAKHSKLH